MSPRHSQDVLSLNGNQQETFDHRTPLKEHFMETRLNFFKSGPDAMKAMSGLDQQIARSGLEKSLVELVRLRASQMNGCAYCIDVHTADARKAGEGERRLATVAVWRETPFFNERERAALEWTESVTRVADTRVPDDVWERVQPHFTPAELVDLTLLVNTINAWNRFAIAFRMMPA
jgi:AhpD family alkylhydroperoxidase